MNSERGGIQQSVTIHTNFLKVSYEKCEIGEEVENNRCSSDVLYECFQNRFPMQH